MAIAYTTGAVGSSDSSGSTIATASFTATAGRNLVVGIVTLNSGSVYRTVSSIADTAGNDAKYFRCGTAQQINLGDGYYMVMDIWHAMNITGHASNVVTATLSGAADTARRIIVLEFSGMHSTNAHDTGYAPSANLDSTSPHTTTAANTAEDNEIVVGFFQDVAGEVGAYSSSSPSVLRQSVSTDFAAATNDAATAGSFNVSVAATNTEDHYCYAKAFKQAAAPSGNPWYYYAQQLRALKDTWRGLLQVPSLEEVKLYGRMRHDMV